MCGPLQGSSSILLTGQLSGIDEAFRESRNFITWAHRKASEFGIARTQPRRLGAREPRIDEISRWYCTGDWSKRSHKLRASSLGRRVARSEIEINDLSICQGDLSRLATESRASIASESQSLHPADDKIRQLGHDWPRSNDFARLWT